jgi:hypothetical protein
MDISLSTASLGAALGAEKKKPAPTGQNKNPNSEIRNPKSPPLPAITNA